MVVDKRDAKRASMIERGRSCKGPMLREGCVGIEWEGWDNWNRYLK